MENTTIGYIVLSILLGSLSLLAAVLVSGKAKHEQNKKNNTLDMC